MTSYGTGTSRTEFTQSWPTLLACTIGTGLGTTGLIFYTFGQFIRPLAAEFHWSRGGISAGLLCFSIGTVLISPFVGQLVDRAGVRLVALLGQAGLAIGLCLVSLAQAQIYTFYAAWFALSLLGAGTSPVVWSRAVAGAFLRHRGLALGIMLCGTGVAGILGPLAAGHLITAFGWRTALRLLAASQIVIGMPLTLALLRPHDAPATARAAEAASGVTLAQAVRHSAFWRLVFAFLLISVGVAGLIVHLPAMLMDRGLTAAAAAAIMATLGYAVIIGRLGLGFLLDRLPPNIVGGCFVLLAAIACLMLANSVALPVVVLMLGLCAGAEVDLLAFLTARLFGLRHYAPIYGCTIAAFSFGAGLGPIAAGMIHDRTGSYDAAIYGFAGAAACAAMLIVSLNAAKKE